MGVFELKLMEQIVNYGFTFTIPAFKKVIFKSNHTGKIYNRPWQTFKTLDQRDYLDRILGSVLKDDDCYWTYEKHERGDLHVHGYVKNINYFGMQRILDKFYCNIGINSSKKYSKISDFRILNNFEAWKDYINKDINKKCDITQQFVRSKYWVSVEESFNLDKGIAHLETNEFNETVIKSGIPSEDNSYNGDYLSNDYLFKGKNKYIVEF